MKGFSLITWDFDDRGLPRRSLQVETDIALLWARAPEMKTILQEFREWALRYAMWDKVGDTYYATVNVLAQLEGK
jgi:hypothetical protein